MAHAGSHGNIETSMRTRASGESCRLYKRPLRRCTTFLLLPSFSTQSHERPALVVRCGVRRGSGLPLRSPALDFLYFINLVIEWENAFFLRIIKITNNGPPCSYPPSHPPLEPKPKPKPRPIDPASKSRCGAVRARTCACTCVCVCVSVCVIFYFMFP